MARLLHLMAGNVSLGVEDKAGQARQAEPLEYENLAGRVAVVLGDPPLE